MRRKTTPALILAVLAAGLLAGCQTRPPSRAASAVSNGPNDRPATIQEQSRNVQGGSFGRE